MSILLCGYAGYLASQIAATLIDSGEDVVVVARSQDVNRDVLPPNVIWHIGDVADDAFLQRVFACHIIDSLVFLNELPSDAQGDALPVYQNSLLPIMTLIGCALRSGIRHVVHSSWLTDENGGDAVLDSEEHLRACDKLLSWSSSEHGVACCSLRLFHDTPANSSPNELIVRFASAHVEALASLRSGASGALIKQIVTESTSSRQDLDDVLQKARNWSALHAPGFVALPRRD